MSLRIVLLSLISIMLVSCSGIVSKNIKTSGIFASITITDNSGSSSTVKVNLAAGGITGSFVTLSEEDTLSITVDGDTIPTEGTGTILGTVYETQIQKSLESKNFQIALTRNSESEHCPEVSAPNSTVTLPKSFTITAPNNNQSVSTGTNLYIAWNNSNSGNMTLSSSSSCTYINNGEQITTNVGKTITSLDNGAKTWTVSDMIDTSKCTPTSITLTLTRSSNGTIDENFKDGIITGKQIRSKTIVLN